MDGNISLGNSIQANTSNGGFDLQNPIRVLHHHQQHPLALHHHPYQNSSIAHPTNLSLMIGSPQVCDQTASHTDFNKQDRGKTRRDKDVMNLMDEGNKTFPWQRVKWTDTMMRLLMTIVSYISEQVVVGGLKRKLMNLHKNGKWKFVSKVMAERGHFVSPQQCEDKFNDLNKRYKRLNEILGRGTSCEVVENPTLLDMMDHVSEKAKEEVRKILSSKHLHYEEMCSYHNGNRLHLPHDLELQRSLRLALMPPREDHDGKDGKRGLHDEKDEVDEEMKFDDLDEFKENQTFSYRFGGGSLKRVKQCQGHDDFSFRNSMTSLDCNRVLGIQVENGGGDVNQVSTEGKKTIMPHKDWMNNWNLQLKEKQWHIREQTLDLEKKRFKWHKFCQKKDWELETTKMKLEKMRLENERMALELKQKEMVIESN